MLGLDWTELALIAVVAVVVIGPKDLPDAVRSIAKGIQKLRRMAGEFQGQVDEVVREAKLEDVRNQINEIRSFNVRDIVEKEIDKDGSIRKTFTEDPIGNPLRDAFAPDAPAHGATVTPPPVQPEAPIAGAGPAVPPAPTLVPPAFIPPGATPPPAPLAASQPAPPPAPPAFVPPSGTSAS
ncbi:Sec-independent protein translocase protein TatB [Falsiroseomonas sp.]|uniref:Sec-independent protein translocase protein TatB n=1 Tax=Falsiroseomonas sp. TaxID=2870721 RepID=UPI003F728D35